MTHTLVLNQDAQPLSLLPVSAMHWQDAIKAIYLDNVQVVHEYEDWVVRSPRVKWQVPAVVMTKLFVAQSRSVRFTPENVYLRDRHTCQYCMRRFLPRELTRDHVLPTKHGGKTRWDNISTACQPCNQRKGHDARIVPQVRPKRPTYWELVERAKEHTLIVPHESWVAYMGWPENRIRVGDRLAWLSPRHMEDEAAVAA